MPGAVPTLGPFVFALALLVAPALCRRFGLPQAVLLLLAGVALGPHGLGLFAAQRPAGGGQAGLVAEALFIPACFFVTGFIVDPLLFAQGASQHLLIAASITAALLLGKWLAARVAGRAFGYNRVKRLAV